MILLKVSHMESVMKFEKKGKCSLRYIRPFKILNRVGLLAYRLDLPPSLWIIHLFLHILSLRSIMEIEATSFVGIWSYLIRSSLMKMS